MGSLQTVHSRRRQRGARLREQIAPGRTTKGRDEVAKHSLAHNYNRQSQDQDTWYVDGSGRLHVGDREHIAAQLDYERRMRLHFQGIATLLARRCDQYRRAADR